MIAFSLTETKKYSCIILDDEKFARENLARQIEQISQLKLLKIFGSPYEALDYVIQTPPDIIFLDIEMPGMDGFKFLNRIYEKGNNSTIIFITGHTSLIDKIPNSQNIFYLIKPVYSHDIQLLVNQLITI